MKHLKSVIFLVVVSIAFISSPVAADENFQYDSDDQQRHFRPSVFDLLVGENERGI
jgi:hypothetical protein